MAPDNEPRAHQANREKAPLPNESRKCTDASTDVETVPSTEKDAQPEPKADTGAHGALRYPRDFETAENGSRRLAAGNDIKNPPRLPATTPRSLRRTEKRHHPETHRESAPEALRPQEWLRGVSGLTTLTMFTTGLRGRCGPLERNAELLPSTLREGLPSSLGRAEKKFRSRKNKNPRYRSTGGS